MASMREKCVAIIMVCLFVLAGCGPEPTPFPVDNPPTTTPEPPPATPEPIQYALAPNTIDRIADRAQISRSALVTQLNEPFDPTTVDPQFDIVVSYGEMPGWIRVEPVQTTALIVRGQPVQIQSIIERAIDPQSVVNVLEIPGAAALPTDLTPFDILRVELANAGRPDGITLRLIHTFVPGVGQIVQQLEAANIRVIVSAATQSDAQIALQTGNADIGIVTWTSSDARTLWTDSGVIDMVDLYTLPVSFLASDELTITYTPGGWPLASR